MLTETPALPKELQLEVTGACNLRCKMCLVRYRPPLNKLEGSMPLATFKRLIDAIPGLEVVTLQGLGEPLLAPDLFEMIDYASARGIRIGFNTNGTLLDEARSRRLIESGLAWLHISVDGATPETYEDIRDRSRFHTVVANAAGFVELKRRMGAAHPELCLVCVAMRKNLSELPALVRLTHQVGVDRLWVQNLSHSFGDADPAGGYEGIRTFVGAEALWPLSTPAVERTFAEARAEAERLGVELRLPRVEPRPAERRPQGTPGCDWPWRAAYVTHDGKVQPCCMIMGADRALLGDLETADFASIWGNDAYAGFRAALMTDEPPDVCRGCSLYKGVF